MKTRSLLLLLACLLASCATAPKAVPVVATAPVVTAPVSPIAETLRAEAAKTAVVASRLEGQVAGLQASTATLRDGMGKALSEADRLRTAKAASEAELQGLWQMLTDSNDKVRNLFAEAEAARLSADEQRDLRAAAEKNYAELTRAAAAADAELVALRLQHQDMASLVNDQAREITGYEEQVRKLSMQAALGTYFKGCIWFVAVIVVIFLGLKIYKPW